MTDAADRPSTALALRTLLAPISWGTTYVVVAELLPAGRPLLVAAGRVLPAALVLIVIARLRTAWRPKGREWATTAALSACNFGLFFPLLIVAVYRLPGGVAAAAGGLQPLFVAGWSTVVSRRRPPRRELAVGVAAAIGVAMVVVKPEADVDLVGIAAAIGANAAFSLGVVLTKRTPAPPDRLAATGWQLLLASAALVPLALAVEGAVPPLDGRAVIGFAYLSLVGTAGAFVLWFAGIRRLPIAAPPLLGLGAPLTGAALGWLVRDEALSIVQLAGFAVTAAAIAYGATRASGGPAPLQSAPAAAGAAGAAGAAVR